MSTTTLSHGYIDHDVPSPEQKTLMQTFFHCLQGMCCVKAVPLHCHRRCLTHNAELSVSQHDLHRTCKLFQVTISTLSLENWHTLTLPNTLQEWKVFISCKVIWSRLRNSCTTDRWREKPCIIPIPTYWLNPTMMFSRK